MTGSRTRLFALAVLLLVVAVGAVMLKPSSSPGAVDSPTPSTTPAAAATREGMPQAGSGTSSPAGPGGASDRGHTTSSTVTKYVGGPTPSAASEPPRSPVSTATKDSKRTKPQRAGDGKTKGHQKRSGKNPRAGQTTKAAEKRRPQLGPEAAVRGYLEAWGSWTWKDTQATVAADATKYVTKQFATELARRDPATVWPLEWQGAQERYGTEKTWVTKLGLNSGARNGPTMKVYTVQITQILTDAHGQIMVQHKDKWMTVAVRRTPAGWRVFTDRPMG